MIRLAGALLLLATAARAQDGPAFGNPFRFTEATGAAVYAGVCAGCHQPGGGGAVGAAAYPSLIGNPRLAAAGYPIGLVLHGHGGMPAFGALLTDAQIAAVVAYIRTAFGNAYADAPSPADVAALR